MKTRAKLMDLQFELDMILSVPLEALGKYEDAVAIMAIELLMMEDQD